MMRLRAVGAVLTGVALLTSLTACGDDAKTGTDEPVTIAVTIKGSTVDPSGDRVEVGVNQPVEITVTADEAGELHIHSDPEQELAYDAGTTKLQAFKIDRPGVVAVESHQLDKVVVQLEVR